MKRMKKMMDEVLADGPSPVDMLNCKPFHNLTDADRKRYAEQDIDLAKIIASSVSS